MKFFGLFLLMTSINTYAALNLKPGLWTIDMKIESNGKTVNPNDEIQKALGKMPEAKRKKMMDEMGSMASGIPDQNGVKVCYSKDMLNNPETMGGQDQKNKKCTTKIIKNTPELVVTNFKCADGSSGDADWKVVRPDLYHGKVNMKSAKGETTKVFYTGKFASSECGEVKPIL